MPGDVRVRLENGPQPDKEVLDLISKASQEKGDRDKSIPTGQEYLVVDITPPYKAIIWHFIETQYPKIESSILNPKTHHFRWLGAFLHQQGKLPNPPHPQRALIIIPLIVIGSLRAQGNIILEVGRSIYVDENTSLELVGSGKLLSIDLGFTK